MASSNINVSHQTYITHCKYCKNESNGHMFCLACHKARIAKRNTMWVDLKESQYQKSKWDADMAYRANMCRASVNAADTELLVQKQRQKQMNYEKIRERISTVDGLTDMICHLLDTIEDLKNQLTDN